MLLTQNLQQPSITAWKSLLQSLFLASQARKGKLLARACRSYFILRMK